VEFNSGRSRMFSCGEATRKVLYQEAKITSSSAMAERPHELGDFKGVGHLKCEVTSKM